MAQDKEAYHLSSVVLTRSRFVNDVFLGVTVSVLPVEGVRGVIREPLVGARLDDVIGGERTELR